MKVSVRDLVEFELRSGDLVWAANGHSRTLEGMKAHQFIQKRYGQEYQPEVRLSYLYEQDGMNIEIHGRADGIIQEDTGFCIDEIKSTTRDLDLLDEMFSEIHWAQAKCYAFIYAAQTDLKAIDVQLTYYNLDNGETRILRHTYTFEELKEFFISLVGSYLRWAKRIQVWKEIRDRTIKNLVFPYRSYRAGQRELIIATYKTIEQGKKLFVQAPTGIGKTIATLFPGLKALFSGLISQIFYLTAKTITRTVAEKALIELQNQGLRIKRLTLTAKDKICFQPEDPCDPEKCIYAKGYYDRVRLGIADIFEHDIWTRSEIEEYARKYSICPFEFSLDLSPWADIVICDYNYVFDPRVYLRHLFLEGGDYLFLIDEAHNLVDRAREMFSAELMKKPFLELKKEVKGSYPQLAKRMQKVNLQMGKLKKERMEDFQKNSPDVLYPSLHQFIQEAERFLKEEKDAPWKDKLLDLYFQVQGFIRASEYYDERYVTLYKESKENFNVKLYCLDPSRLLAEAFKRGRAAILFSATLSPIEYFMKILGAEESAYKLKLKSPFDEKKLCLMMHTGISTRYTQRETSYDPLAEVISTVVNSRKGNYLIFFPSYDYLLRVYDRFDSQNQGVRTLVQTPGMSEAEREAFLAQFQKDPDESLVGFALMGGIFGEGIDLKGSRLSGAIIVGVGLPQLCLEREMIRSYFQSTLNQGFEFAYMYPGLNKVFQAVGRVIRTEEDRGIVMLIDERFGHLSYIRLFPPEWKNILSISKLPEIQEVIQSFWR